MSTPIGVVVPNGVPGVDRDRLLGWIEGIEAGPFVSLVVPDRLIYPNLDPTMVLAAAAAMTSRVELCWSISIAPLRPRSWWAKQVSTLVRMAGPGRLTLGVGVGARKDDYVEAGVPMEQRGRILDDHLEYLEQLHADEADDQGPGPHLPSDEPSILLGGASPGALRRLVRWGDGYIAGGLAPQFVGYEVEATRAAWREADKPGEPRIVAGGFFSSSTDVDDDAQRHYRHYMARGGIPDHVAAGIFRGADGVRTAVEQFRALGADVVQLFPCTDDLDELEWLADLTPGL